jgi:hypothetical protein
MNTLGTAKAELIARLQSLPAPHLSACANADEIGAVANHLCNMTAAVDKYILAIGDELNRSSTARVDLMQFTHVLRDALDGNATYEITCAAECAAEEATFRAA